MKKCCEKWHKAWRIKLYIGNNTDVLSHRKYWGFCSECGSSLSEWCCCGGKGIMEDPFKDGILRQCTICDKFIKPIKGDLPKELVVDNDDVVLYRVFAKKINELIQYLKAKEGK